MTTALKVSVPKKAEISNGSVGIALPRHDCVCFRG
jgi:hypothetical protein